MSLQPFFAACGSLVVALVQAGCISSNDRLTFPAKPTASTADEIAFDVSGDGRLDFCLRTDATGRLDLVCYDDDEDGEDDRVYRLTQYESERVPHFIILLDSIPYQSIADRWLADRWSWFDAPQKVIPPFPTMSGVIFTRMLHAPPLGGMINQYYDPVAGERQDRIMARAGGSMNPWELRLDYRLRYWENGLSFLKPRPWFHAELARAKRALDECPDRVTIVYLASTAGMLSRYGAAGLDEVLDGVEQLCLNVLYDRQGAVKISIVADHGHNLIAGSRIDVPAMLRADGFVPGDHIAGTQDVVVELDGLVNYAGVHTRRAAAVAEALTAHPEVELAMYLDGERVIVRNRDGRACVEFRSRSFRYTALETDVLEYEPVIEKLRAAGRLDADGFAPDRDWFDATLDHHWPDAPRRLWDAFHGLAVSAPDVMMTTKPGFFVGLSSMEWFITMASTHGGLDQVDSATFVLTMTGRAKHPMRTEDVFPTIEPTYDPDRKPQ